MNFVGYINTQQWLRSYGDQAIKMITKNLHWMRYHGWLRIWLGGIWYCGEKNDDNGYSIVDYTVNPQLGTQEDLDDFLRQAHNMGIKVGCDVVPNHMSIESSLVQDATADMLYVVNPEEAVSLSMAGVPLFFGAKAYSKVKTRRLGEFYTRTMFMDGVQINLNWNSKKIKNYFRGIFQKIREMGFDFARVDCAELLLEDVTKADANNLIACVRSEESIREIIGVADGMELFLECFTPEIVKNDFGSNVYTVDCSFVINGLEESWEEFEEKALRYRGYRNYTTVLGGHDKEPFRNQFGKPFNKSLLQKLSPEFNCCIIDIPTITGYQATGNEPIEVVGLWDCTKGTSKTHRDLGRQPIHLIV